MHDVSSHLSSVSDSANFPGTAFLTAIFPDDSEHTATNGKP